MLTTKVVYNADSIITPDVAAKIAQCANHFESNVYVHYKGMNLCVDSLIGILALNVHNGSEIEVGADGVDAEEALKAVCAVFAGEA